MAFFPSLLSDSFKMTLWKIQTKAHKHADTRKRLYTHKHVTLNALRTVYTQATHCFPQIFYRLSQSWIATSKARWWIFSCPHKTQGSGASVQIQPHNDSQQPMTTAFLHIRKYTWHCAQTSTALSHRSPTEQAGDDWSQNNGSALIHFRWLSVTCGVQPKAKGHCGTAALYNVTLGLANSQAISLAAWELAWGDGGRKRAG